ncbi:phage tail tape measure protein [Streptomyces sp. NPDC047972]|uniref:phage tail tape measure protein n=1 Tax=Streptomyces sp. NPDC047972 TaxID=3365493 RepID=UPI0037219AC6
MPVLDELLVRISMDSSGVEEGAQETTSRLDGLAAPAAAAGIAAGAVFAVGIAGAMDIAEAQHQLQDSLGLTSQEAERAGGIAGDVFSDGFGESLEEVTSGLATVTQAMGKLGDFTDAELKDMTKSALGLAKKMEVDVADASTAAGQLIKQGLVKDGTEAFDVLAKAAQVLPKSMLADVPAVVQEYGTHFKRIGLDAKTAFGMMSQFVKAGGKDIDQAADVLHEFARITSEETDRAKEGFKSLGLDGTKMLADIGKGGKPAAAALQLTLDKLRGVQDPAKRAQLGVALFGDMAGEAADALLAMNPQTAQAASGMDAAAGASKKLNESMESSPAQQMDAAMRTLQMTLGEALLPVVKTVSEFIKEHKDEIKEWTPIVLLLVTALGLMAAAIWVVNIAMMANPVGLIIAGIVALIAIVVVLVMKWDEVKAALLAYWEQMKADALRIWNAVTKFFADAWEKTKTDAIRVWNAIVGFLTGAWNKTKADALRVWNAITGALATAWGKTKADAARIWNAITGFLSAAWTKTKADAVRLWTSITGFVSGQWNNLVASVRTAVAKIGGFFGGMWDGITHGLKSALNGAIWLINSAIGGINSLIQGANRIPGVSIPYVPYIPYLAEGGVTTGPTLAMIGEGREQEAVLPLSKLEALINTHAPTTMAAPSTGKVEPLRVVLTASMDAGAFRDAFQYEVRTKAGSSVARYAGEDV